MVMAALHNAQRSVCEPALVMPPDWVRPADSFRSAVMPAQNCKASALGKAVKGSDLCGNDATPDLVDAGNGLQKFGDEVESFRTVGLDNLPSQFAALPFHQNEDVDEIGKSVALCGLEQVSMGQKPAMGPGGVELGPADVGRS